MIEFHDSRLQKEVVLNKVVQGYISTDDAISWFGVQDSVEMLDSLRVLTRMITQSRAENSDVGKAIVNSGLKPTFTPCVLLSSGSLNTQIAKLLQLPPNEYMKSFRLLVALQSIADTRRREICGQSCNHWWHGDLDSEDYLRRIEEKYESGNL